LNLIRLIFVLYLKCIASLILKNQDSVQKLTKEVVANLQVRRDR